MANPQLLLYQEVILDHNKKPRNWGEFPDASIHSEGLNPLCGDHLFLHLNLTDEGLTDIKFTGESCAICKASTSMMTTMVKGKDKSTVEQMITEFRSMVKGDLDPETQENILGRLKVFKGISGLPSRVKCAVLPWVTLSSAIAGEAIATTETADDNSNTDFSPGL
jgi:nitrogen fixation protein NifU and related proteins